MHGATIKIMLCDSFDGNVCVCVCVQLKKWPTDCIRRNVRFLLITTVYQLLRLFESKHDRRVLVGNTFK